MKIVRIYEVHTQIKWEIDTDGRLRNNEYTFPPIQQW